jgi:hypothetical protein
VARREVAAARGTLVTLAPAAPAGPSRGIAVAWKLAVAVAVVIAAGVVGVNLGWPYVLGPVLGWIVYKFIVGNLRSLAHGARMGAPDDDEVTGPTPVGTDERTMFWCEECGTEVLLLVRGTARAPSHCGQRMHERTEIPN